MKYWEYYIKNCRKNCFQVYTETFIKYIRELGHNDVPTTFQITEIIKNVVSNLDATKLDIKNKNISRKSPYWGN